METCFERLIFRKRKKDSWYWLKPGHLSFFRLSGAPSKVGAIVILTFYTFSTNEITALIFNSSTALGLFERSVKLVNTLRISIALAYDVAPVSQKKLRWSQFISKKKVLNICKKDQCLFGEKVLDRR